MNVWAGNERKDALAIPTDRNGIARLGLTKNDAEVNTDHRWKACGDFGVISPVLKYKESIEVDAAYAVCERHGTDSSWLEAKSFPTKQIVGQGIVAANTCGKVSTSVRPGELVIFVRSLS